MKRKLLLLVVFATYAGWTQPSLASAQSVSPIEPPADASEQLLTETLRQLQGVATAGEPAAKRTPAQEAQRRKKIVAYADALVQRFPKSSYREQALLQKLEALAGLARRDRASLQTLLKTTQSISQSHPQGKLASENAFFAIQAFVYGARAEHMPRARFLQGTIERYRAFLEDYPDSPRRAVIYGSLIRNFGRTQQFEKGFDALEKMYTEFPDDPNTIRAQDELLATAIEGKPFEGVYVTSKGKTVSTTDYKGEVLVIHFWSHSSRPSLAAIPKLLQLHTLYERRGLALLGVTLDENEYEIKTAMKQFKTPWPQCVSQKRSQAGAAIEVRLVEPTFFVLDQEGIIRSVRHDAVLRDLVEKLAS